MDDDTGTYTSTFVNPSSSVARDDSTSGSGRTYLTDLFNASPMSTPQRNSREEERRALSGKAGDPPIGGAAGRVLDESLGLTGLASRMKQFHLTPKTSSVSFAENERAARYREEGEDEYESDDDSRPGMYFRDARDQGLSSIPEKSTGGTNAERLRLPDGMKQSDLFEASSDTSVRVVRPVAASLTTASNGIPKIMVQFYAEMTDELEKYQFSYGNNWKIEQLKAAAKEFGISLS